MTFRTAAPLAALVLTLVSSAAPARAQDTAAPAATPADVAALRASMLASDSILVARIEIEFLGHRDTTGRVGTEWKSKRVSINQVKGRWMKRMAAALLPPAAAPRPEPCPIAAAPGGLEKPWKLTALWITHDGRGQTFIDLPQRCAIAAIKGGPQMSFAIDAVAADSLVALYREALFADSLLQAMKSAPPSLAGKPVVSELPPAKLPVPLGPAAPEYPASARADRIEGTVVVEALVDKEGRVAEAHVKDGVARLNAAAIAAVRRMRFAPATDAAGAPVAARADVPVVFRLDATPAPKR